MCRNITTLRGLEPPVTSAEVHAAAEQYVRKVSGITHPSALTAEAFESAVEQIAAITAELLAGLPPRRNPPPTEPPLRRLARQAG
ncbi:MAG: DUF2277 domain-containing protein [Candidatus Nanopelagicales bacterium]